MKRIVNTLDKLNSGKRACAVFVLCATTAIALPAQTFTTLYSFDGTDGEAYAGLVQATNGDFYGTNDGTIFKITAGGTLTTLSVALSYGGLVQATNGDFYGTTYQGGANGGGTVFKMTPSGTLTTLYNFCSKYDCGDGEYSRAELVQATNGDFYGTGCCGGQHPEGVVGSLSTGLGPFLKTLPASGKVGTAVKILGTNLTGATSVGFNGTAALFRVASSSEITTTVPVGASSGTVQVVTPSGTLSTYVAFTVP